MDYETYIKLGLEAQGLSAQDGDIESVKAMLQTINEEQKHIDEFSDLKTKQSIKSFDKGVVKDD